MARVAGQGGGSSYASQQAAALRDQVATAQLMKQAADELLSAANMLSLNSSGSYSGGPNGSRPTTGGNQTGRPNHGAPPSGGRGIAGIKNRIATQVHQNYGAASGPSFRPVHDANGEHVGYRQYNSDGSFNRQRLFTDDGESQAGLIGEASAATRRSTISRVVGGAATGGVMGASRALPVVGEGLLAVEAGHEVLTQIGQQRQANAQYQSIYGGSNAGTGFSNRAQQTGFRLGQMFSGGLTGSQANEAFQGVSNLGFQGSQRSSDLNFISSNYKSLGMGVAQSLELISTASKTLNTNLVGLQTSLKQVSDTARTTGQNAASARAAFASNYSTIATSAPGATAAPIAGALTAAQTNLGRSMQNLNFTGTLTSLSGQALLASGSGLSIPQVQSALQNNPSLIATTQDQNLGAALSPFLTSDLKAQIDKLAGGKKDSATVASITNQIIGSVNSYAIMAALNARVPGINLTGPVQAVQLMVQFYLSGSTIFGSAAATQNQGNQRNVSKIPSPGGGGPLKGPAAGSVPGMGTATSGLGGSAGTNTNPQTAKGVNPVVDQALSALKGKNVIVTTKGGQQRVVSIKTAAESYTDQIATGSALMADDPSQSVSQALGGSKESNYYSTGGANTLNTDPGTVGTKSSGVNSAAGESVDAYTNAQNKKTSKASSGTVVISPSAELQQLLDFKATGNVSVATQAAANGNTPVPGSPVFGQ